MQTIRGGVSLAAVLISVVLGACANPSAKPSEQKGEPTSRQEPTAEMYRYAFGRALDQVSQGEYEEAYPALVAVIQSPFFDQFEPEQRHAGLLVAGLIALDLDKPAEAHPFLVKSSSLPEADGEDWYGRLLAADGVNQQADVILSLTQLARRWPEKLGELNDRFVVRVAHDARDVPGGQPALHDLLSSLFDAKWTVEGGIEPSYLWRDLASLELERQQLARAQEVMSRIKDPHVIISMKVDRRFDPLRKVVPQYFHVEEAAANAVDLRRSIAQRSPRSMDAIVQLTYALLDAGRYEEVLSTTDDVLRKVDSSAGQEAHYDDMDKLIWIHDNRSRAFAATQRWSEAETELRAAANMKENGERNVSNIINLAWFYAHAGRSDEALSVLPDLGSGMSPFGLMQMHGARYAAALQKGDMQIANESLEYLDKHRDDALPTWQWTLLIANRLDEVAALLIGRLNNPLQRAEALQELQIYANPQFAPQRALWDARLKKVRERNDVMRAVEAVGRIESYFIPESPI